MHSLSLNQSLTSGVSGPFAIPSVVSGAEKAVKDLEQLAAADPEALIDSIEELLPIGTSQDAGVATGVSAGLVSGVTGLADPVLSKGNGSLTQPQGGGYTPAVKCGAELLLLLCCSGGCCTQVVPFGCTKAVPFPFWLLSGKYSSHSIQAQHGKDMFHSSAVGPHAARQGSRLRATASTYVPFVAPHQARKSFDAVQEFALWQHAPVSKGFQFLCNHRIAVFIDYSGDAAASWR